MLFEKRAEEQTRVSPGSQVDGYARLALSGTAPVQGMDMFTTPGGLGRGAAGAFASRGAGVFAKPAREARFSAVVYLLQIAYNDDDILLSRVGGHSRRFREFELFKVVAIFDDFDQPRPCSGGKSSKSPQIAVTFFFDPYRKKKSVIC